MNKRINTSVFIDFMRGLLIFVVLNRGRTWFRCRHWQFNSARSLLIQNTVYTYNPNTIPETVL